MQNNTAIKQQEILAQVSTDEVVGAGENVVEFQARHQLIAQQSEEACHLEGNVGSADFDLFEEKYGIGSFA